MSIIINNERRIPGVRFCLLIFNAPVPPVAGQKVIFFIAAWVISNGRKPRRARARRQGRPVLLLKGALPHKLKRQGEGSNREAAL